MDGNAVLRNYGEDNLFLGVYAGNFSMTGVQNTAIGRQALRDNITPVWEIRP